MGGELNKISLLLLFDLSSDGGSEVDGGSEGPEADGGGESG